MKHYNLYSGCHDGDFDFIPYSRCQLVNHNDYFVLNEHRELSHVLDKFADFIKKHGNELDPECCYFVALGGTFETAPDPVALFPAEGSTRYDYLKEWTSYKGIYTPFEQKDYTVRDECDDEAEVFKAWCDKDAKIYFKGAYKDVTAKLNEGEYYSLCDLDGNEIETSIDFD